MRFILGPIMIIVGVLMMKYTVWITEQVGKVEFAEHLPYPLAGTYSWWRLVGLVLIILAFLWMFGYLNFGSTGLVIPE